MDGYVQRLALRGWYVMARSLRRVAVMEALRCVRLKRRTLLRLCSHAARSRSARSLLAVVRARPSGYEWH